MKHIKESLLQGSTYKGHHRKRVSSRYIDLICNGKVYYTDTSYQPWERLVENVSIKAFVQWVHKNIDLQSDRVLSDINKIREENGCDILKVTV